MSRANHRNGKEQCPRQTAAGARCENPVLPDKDVCFAHDPESKARAALGRKMSGGARKYPNIQVVDAEEADDYVIDNLLNVVEALKGRQNTNDVAREMTTALAALDRAYDRRASRGADVTLVEVVYVNDWRAD